MSLNSDIRSLQTLQNTTEKEMIKQYKLALTSINHQLADIYAKYGSGGTLSYSDMAKYDRLKKLEKEVFVQLNLLSSNNKTLINKGLTNIYSDGYYRTAFTLESGVQAKLSYSKLNPKTIQLAIQNPISGLTLNERLSKNRAELLIRIKQDITQGLIRGDGYPVIARTMRDVLEGDAAKATRIIQTEGNRLHNAARNDSIVHAQEQGVKLKKIWVASLDDKTRDRHAELDGQAADEDGLFWMDGLSAPHPGVFGVAELDINCRCTTRIEIVGFEPTVRRVRGEGVIPYTSYEDWKANRID